MIISIIGVQHHGSSNTSLILFISGFGLHGQFMSVGIAKFIDKHRLQRHVFTLHGCLLGHCSNDLFQIQSLVALLASPIGILLLALGLLIYHGTQTGQQLSA